MATETLRDLVVSLSLNTDNFTKNLRSVTLQMKEAQSDFLLAGAGVANFGNTAAGAAAKLQLMQNRLTLQERAVDQYTRRLNTARDNLEKSKTSYDKLGVALDNARNEHARLTEEVKKAQAAYDVYKGSMGDSAQTTLDAKAKLDEMKAAQKAASEEVKKAQSAYDAAGRSLQNNADKVTRARTALNGAEAELKNIRKEVTLLKSALYNAGDWFVRMGESAASAGRALQTAGRNLTRYISAPVAALGLASVKASVDFESAFTMVRKTVDATESQYAALANAATDMSEQVAASATEISAVMATAGQLGIYNDNIAEFTRTIQDLSVSTEDLKGSEAATVIAKFMNIAQTDQSQVKNLASTVVELGNNFATTEGAIMEMALRLAAAGKQVGLTESQILGFAAALSSVGLEAQAGGTAMSKALKMMEVAAVEGGDALQDFARVAGMTEDEFRALWQSDPAAGFMAFINGLSKLDDEGMSAIAVLNELGLTEIRLSDTLLRSVNANELFTRAIDSANSAWAENTALTREADKFYGTTASRLKNLQNKAVNLGRSLGDDLNPQVQGLIDMANSILDSLDALDASQVRAIMRAAGVAAAIGPIALGAGKLTYALGDASSGIGKLLKSLAGMRAQSKVTGESMLSLITATAGGKAAFVALGVALVGAGAALAYYTSDAYKAKKAIEELGDAAAKWQATPAQTLFGGQGLSFFGLTQDDFRQGEESLSTMENWRDALVEVWTDGKRETDEIVSQWTQSFSAFTDDTRQKLLELKRSAGDEGVISEGIDEDIETLDNLDAAISELLKKRQNGLFTDEDLKTLQDAMDKRQAIVIKYRLEEDSAQGYDAILQGIKDEERRAQLEKRDASMQVYDEAVLAAAQGHAAIVDDLEKQYDLQASILEQQGDAEALEKLNDQYMADRLAAAREYAQVLSETSAPVLESEDADKARSQMEELIGLIGQYATSDGKEKTGFLQQISDLAGELDKDAMVEYLALLTQIQGLTEQGISQDELTALFGEDYSKYISQLSEIVDYLNQYQELGDLKSLGDIFGNLQDEVVTIGVKLNDTDIDTERQRLETIMGAAIETGVIIKPTGMDAAALAKWKRENPVDIEATVTLGSLYDNPEDALSDQLADFFDENGQQLPITMVGADQLSSDMMVVLTGDGRKNIIITASYGDYETEELLGLIQEGTFNETAVNLGLAVQSTDITKLERLLRQVREATEGGLFAPNVGMLERNISEDFDQERLGEISAFVADIYARLEAGGEVTQSEIDTLNTVLELMDALSQLNAKEGTDLGAEIMESIRQEMEKTGWEGAAEDISGALKGALEKHLGSDAMGPVGKSGMDALARSILANKDPVIAAARQIGRQVAAAINGGMTQTGGGAAPDGAAAASAGSFMGRAGAAMMESIGMGALAEAPRQARVIASAARYLSTAAGQAVMTGAPSYSRVYNQSSTVNMTGNTFQVRSEADIQQLAYQIAAINRRRQKGCGA